MNAMDFAYEEQLSEEIIGFCEEVYVEALERGCAAVECDAWALLEAAVAEMNWAFGGVELPEEWFNTYVG